MQPDQSTITVMPDIANVSYDVPYHEVCLNSRGKAKIIPDNHDIVSFIVYNTATCAPYLEYITFVVGGVECMKYSKEEFSKCQNLVPHGHFMSKCASQYTHVRFTYNQEYIIANETFHMIDELVEEEEISDTEYEFFDGHTYNVGRRVTKHKVPSGKKIKALLKGAEVIVPQFVIVTSSQVVAANKEMHIPFWEEVRINPKNKDGKEYITSLLRKHNIKMTNGTSVQDAIQDGKPFYVRVQNILKYLPSGKAEKLYIF